MARSSAENHVLSTEEMLAAQVQVSHTMMVRVAAICLKCVVDLGIPDIVADKNVISRSELLKKLPNIPPSKSPLVHRIMRLLAQMGYFKIIENKSNGDEENHDELVLYSLTPLSRVLLKTEPFSLSSYVLGSNNPYSTSTWQSISKWLQSDAKGSMFEFQHGKSMWDVASQTPEFNSLTNERMAADSRVMMKGVVEKCREAFEGLRTLVDVGGGNGASAIAIAEAYPRLKCTVYDLPHVVASVPQNSLVDAIGGNMFEHIPPADAIFFKTVLHNWSDEDCANILKRCKDAIPTEGGKVIIVDIVLKDSDNSIESAMQLLFDVSMMAFAEGKERNEREWKKIFLDAGFTDYRITPIGFRSLIEVFP